MSRHLNPVPSATEHVAVEAEQRYRAMAGMDEPLEQRAARARLHADALRDIVVRDALNQCFAQDVIDGTLIHNVETDTFVNRDLADDDFKAEAVAAYKRFLAERSA